MSDGKQLLDGMARPFFYFSQPAFLSFICNFYFFYYYFLVSVHLCVGDLHYTVKNCFKASCRVT